MERGKESMWRGEGNRHKGRGDDSECSNVPIVCVPQHAGLSVCVSMALSAHGECANNVLMCMWFMVIP